MHACVNEPFYWGTRKSSLSVLGHAVIQHSVIHLAIVSHSYCARVLASTEEEIMLVLSSPYIPVTKAHNKQSKKGRVYVWGAKYIRGK
jgi:hypothetical protein